MAASLYQELKDAGVPLDSHESDLYAKVTPTSAEILAHWNRNPKTFVSNLDGQLWFDIPFAYEPFWERVSRRAADPKAAHADAHERTTEITIRRGTAKP